MGEKSLLLDKMRLEAENKELRAEIANLKDLHKALEFLKNYADDINRLNKELLEVYYALSKEEKREQLKREITRLETRIAEVSYGLSK